MDTLPEVGGGISLAKTLLGPGLVGSPNLWLPETQVVIPHRRTLLHDHGKYAAHLLHTNFFKNAASRGYARPWKTVSLLVLKTSRGLTTGATPLSITHSQSSSHPMHLDRLQVRSKESSVPLADHWS